MTARPSGELPPPSEPILLYRELCRSGRLEPDPAQQFVVERLQSLYRALLDYHPGSGVRGWFVRLGLAERNGAHPPMGFYLHGPVGRGKTMVMDLFFGTVAGTPKRRVHFHALMLEVHDRIEHHRRAQTHDPIPAVAADLAGAATLYCIDEFQVDDIADAVILERLFAALFDAGVVVVATSNLAPGELYAHGLHRDRFLPFIALLERQLLVLELDSGRDWRLARLRGKRVYHQPLGEEAHRALEESFAELTDSAPGEPLTLTVKGHRLTVPRTARGVAWFGFADLCAQPLGAVDYLAIAERFAAIVVEGIPRLGPERRDEARRFNILIDTLYEARALLIASAEAPPEEIYAAGDGTFEFRRTVSRLVEMQSEDYIARRPHPRGPAAPPAESS